MLDEAAWPAFIAELLRNMGVRVAPGALEAAQVCVCVYVGVCVAPGALEVAQVCAFACVCVRVRVHVCVLCMCV